MKSIQSNPVNESDKKFDSPRKNFFFQILDFQSYLKRTNDPQIGSICYYYALVFPMFQQVQFQTLTMSKNKV